VRHAAGARAAAVRRRRLARRRGVSEFADFEVGWEFERVL